MAQFDVDDLRVRGFAGFLPMEKLDAEPPQVPTTSGAYAVVRSETGNPAFLERNPAGWWKGKDPTVPLGKLQARWVHGAQTLYLGKALSLRERIGLLVQFSRGERVMHYGGRLLWQVVQCERLLVAWVEDPAYAGREAALMGEFIAAYGRLPFANLRRERVRG